MHPDPRDVERLLPLKRELERKLVTMPGVTGIDIGLKEVGGEQTQTPAILVFVESKGRHARRDEIPRAVDGVPVDVIEATFKPSADPVATAPPPQLDSTRYDPVKGGACISAARITSTYGSLGMMVRDKANGDYLWLSAYHVMCGDSSWPLADKRIVQPAVALGGNPARDTIGSIVRGLHGQVPVSWGYDLYVDAAVSTIDGRRAEPSIVRMGKPQGARNGRLGGDVTKYGATTGLRFGTVVSTSFTVVIAGVWFYYQYRTEPAAPGEPPLAMPGDSGAPVLDSESYAIGLVIAGDGVRYSTVNPIGQIFEALKVTL